MPANDTMNERPNHNATIGFKIDYRGETIDRESSPY